MDPIRKRCVDRNVKKGLARSFSKDEALEVYRCMARARKFEEYIIAAEEHDHNLFKIKIHLSTGQEGVAAALAVALRHNCQVFTQHRSMDLYIAYGAPPGKIRDECLCLDSGCAGGSIGGSFNYIAPYIQMYGHTGFIGENISVGVGAALGNGKRTICVFGDGAAEEDYALEAYGFAVTHNLPVLFVCNDNGLSVLSPLGKRRTWDVEDVARSMGMEAIDMADDPFSLIAYIRSLDPAKPAFINCHVNRDYWHAGTGVDGPPEWDRYLLVRGELIDLGYKREIENAEAAADEEMRHVWEAYL